MASLIQWLRSLIRKWLGKPATASNPVPVPPALTAAPAALQLQACVSVVIPALNEARRIADVVRYALDDPATADVLVIDDSSIDDTVERARQAGATVVTSSMLGKGASMEDGVRLARQELLVYLDGDLAGLRPGIISDLCRPLLTGEADFVKARFGRGGGRVTELTAKPMLKVFFPELAHIAQPLGGIIAARRSLLRSLSFESAYGVDIGLLIDASRAGARVTEVDIGSLEHDSQPLLDLTAMANEVARVIYSRARAAGRLHVDQIISMYETQRQATASIDYIISRRRERRRLVLLDMDGTITPSRYALELAKSTGHEAALHGLLDGRSIDASTRSAAIAALFRFVPRPQFERVAQSLEIRPGVIEWVKQMRRAGFMVGLVSDSYFVGAEVMRRRIFADFALAHVLQFNAEVCSGELRVNPAFLPDEETGNAELCKSHVLRRFRSDTQGALFDEIWAVGDNLNDLQMLALADRSFVIEPKAAALLNVPGIQGIASFEELLPLVPVAPASTSTSASA